MRKWNVHNVCAGMPQAQMAADERAQKLREEADARFTDQQRAAEQVIPT